MEEHVEPVRAQVSEAATAELGGIEHPGLPVQQTVKLELVVNLKPRKRSASQYRNIVVAADEVIEQVHRVSCRRGCGGMLTHPRCCAADRPTDMQCARAPGNRAIL